MDVRVDPLRRKTKKMKQQIKKQKHTDLMLSKRRVTIMIDGDLDKKLRLIQAEKIQKENRSVSFSSVLNEYLRKVLK